MGTEPPKFKLFPHDEHPQTIAKNSSLMGLGRRCYWGVCSAFSAGIGVFPPDRSFGAGWSRGVSGLGGAAVLYCAAGRAAGGCRVLRGQGVRIAALSRREIDWRSGR